jgi:transmembrane sensor
VFMPVQAISIQTARMDDLQFKELIDRYLDKTASAADLAELNKLEQFFPTTEDATSAGDQDKHRFLKARIYLNISTHIQPKKYFQWLGAAVVAALILVVLMPKVNTLTGKRTEIVYNQVKTSAGKIKEVRLSDGTTVTLNAGSTLSYPAEFTDSTREVTLTGEAFFKVKHNVDQPFIVHAGALTTRVLGTSFDVYAYPESGDLRITLATGRIQIAKQKTRLATLIPNQQLVFNKGRNTTQMTVVNAADYSGWRTGQQSFKQARLDEVGLYLNKWYGLDVAFDNQILKSYKITTRFTTNMPVRQVLDIIAASSCAKYTMHKNKVVLSGRGCRIDTEVITPKPNAM